MARRFQKKDSTATLVAPDGEISARNISIVVGSKWAAYYPELLTELYSDATEEEFEQKAFTSLAAEQFTPPAQSPVSSASVGTGNGSDKDFSVTLAHVTPIMRGSLSIKVALAALKALKDFGDVSPGLFDTILQAHTAGAAGNNIQVVLTGDSAAAIKALLDLGDLATNLDTVVEATTAGAAGNSITVATLADGDPAVKASLDLGTLAGGDCDTVVEAHIAGVAGNSITVSLTGDSGPGAGVTIDPVVAGAVAIHYESGVSTVGNVETAITALSGADDVIDVKTPGTGATVLTSPGDDFVATSLAGGANADPVSISRTGSALTIHFTLAVSTVSNVETAIAALTGADDIIGVKTPGTGASVLATPGDVFTATNLAGGADAENVTIDVAGSVVTIHYQPDVSTVSDVEAAIAALSGGDDIVDIKTAGTGATVLTGAAAFSATNLAGGTNASTPVVAIDNYSGVVSGGSGPTAVTGTIDYTSGALSIHFTTAPPSGQAITADFDPENFITIAGTFTSIAGTKVFKNGAELEHGVGSNKFLVIGTNRILLGTGANGTDVYTIAYLS